MPDDQSIESVYRRHGAAVYRRALHILGAAADAHEVVQDVFMGLFENPSQYAGKSSMTTFLYSATTHACLNRLRNRRTRERLLRGNGALSPAEVDDSLSPEQQLVLRRALADMPEDVAHAVVYYCVDGLTHEEIAGLLACSRRHVGNLLDRANEWGRRQDG